MSKRRQEANALPKRWDWLFNGFRRYCIRYSRKHFHAVRISSESANIPLSGPILVALNHPGWWDPVLCTVLSKEFGNLRHYGAIEAQMARAYPLFGYMGIFSVDNQSIRGAAEFLATGTAILKQPENVVWVTAQGRFVDVRVRPLNLQSGVGHLAARMTTGWVLPVAFEYAFWNESTPEALIRIAQPIAIQEHPGKSPKDWLMLIEERLTATLDALNQEAITRDPLRFRSLVSGETGVGGPYDWFRRMLAWFRGQRFDPSHEGEKPQ